MAVRKINPWLKLALELGPVLLFFVVFQRYLVDGVATQGLKG